jgi:hypothetical protein
MGFADRVDILENDAPHNYNEVQRAGILRWLSRWLLNQEPATQNPAITLLSAKEYQCTPDGNVMTLPGARSVYDLNEDMENILAKQRAAAWTSADRTLWIEQVRHLAGIRKLSELSKPRIESLGTIDRNKYHIEKLVISSERDIAIPALLFLPEHATSDHVTLYVHQEGKAADAAPGGPIERRVLAGETVLAIDARGTGQTQPVLQITGYLVEFQEASLAYLLGRSYVGMRAEDILVSARYASERFSAEKPTKIHLVAIGNIGVSALHAAALEPNLFSNVAISQCLVSWTHVIHHRLNHNIMPYVVHGALKYYDLPGLAATLGERLTIRQPVDAEGHRIPTGKSEKNIAE